MYLHMSILGGKNLYGIIFPHTPREISFKIYSQNIIVVVQYNILKIFTMHFGKINQTDFILYCSFINEWKRNLY